MQENNASRITREERGAALACGKQKPRSTVSMIAGCTGHHLRHYRSRRRTEQIELTDVPSNESDCHIPGRWQRLSTKSIPGKRLLLHTRQATAQQLTAFAFYLGK
ncbi:hypothetical protein [Rhizobium sp. SAFR-030]|uniref:hypothetical protein n=1 Tax=Rhizobium sp. SAFR-030 TaxID=3387277 RepID=UPI003F7D8719